MDKKKYHPASGIMCEQTEELLREAKRLYKKTKDEDMRDVMQDAAIGHQIMCRYAIFGRTDYGNAIKQVMDRAAQMGVPFPYVLVDGGPAKRADTGDVPAGLQYFYDAESHSEDT